MNAPRWAAVRPSVTALVAVAAVALAASGCATRHAALAADPAGVLTAQAAPSASPSGEPSSPASTPSVKPSTPTPTPKKSPTPAAKPTAAKPSTAPVPSNLAQKLKTLPVSTTQVIIAHAPSTSTTYATLETFTKSHGVWTRAFDPMDARIGSKGFSDHHVEGIATTPIGVYGFGGTMYGINANPGVKFGYHRLVTDDWWNENSDSPAYNTFQHSTANPGGASEALWEQTVAYQYFAFIAYNVPAVAGRGSGIFLHVGTGRATAGCVSLAKSNLIKVLTWLDPAKHPRIVLSPDADLHRY
jgi:L,D-peptidoglycan transpeptidase YkuD (ErfK/YbiS/YcfS/YnhG family)